MSAYGFNSDATGRTIVCPTCGLRYPITAKFCGQDGTILSGLAPQPSTPGGPKHCPSCRTVYPSYAQFCPADATHLVSSSPTVATSTAKAASAMTEAVNTAAPPKVTDNRDHTQHVSREVLSANNPHSDSEIGFGGSSNEDLSQENRVIGKTIAGKYKVEGLLGEGGMAQVFRATHLGLDRPVVIKLMHSSMPSMDTAMKRFEQECKVTAKLDHPNVVSVFDVGTLEGRRPYLVMEFIQGESLRDYLDREGSMSIQDACTVMMQVCSGLAEAHAMGIVHRDLKPENIMLRERSDRPDWVKIVDFGIAHLKQGGQRLTRTGIAIGTVDYMSPEYLSDKPIDNRSDIYALGVIMYEIMAGRCPFVAETAEAVMAKHLWGTPMPLSHFRTDLPAGCLFDQLAEKSLQKEPDDRFQSVTDMRDDLQRAFKEYQMTQKNS
ncbi:MAG: protein kinase [Candidatus Obscuribacterales bacterium]|nr:protein kinase [Candidatus Obscuribacterales bacterium]